MDDKNKIFHELGEVKGELNGVKQTVARIESKLDSINSVSVVDFEKARDEIETKFGDHEGRIDELEKRAIRNDNSFMRKLSNSFETKFIGWIIALALAGLVWIIVVQNHEMKELSNFINTVRSK